MPVLVLQALAVQRGAPGGGAAQEAPAPHVAEGPDEVAHPLEAEHRVEDEEGHQRLAPGGVGRAGGREAGHRAGFGDALLQDLALNRLPIRQLHLGVDRVVQLPEGGVDLHLGEQGVHPEGAGLVGDDGNHPRAHPLVPQQVPQQLGEPHGGRHLLLPRALVELGEHRLGGLGEALLAHHPAGERAAQLAAPGHEVLVGVAAPGRPVVRRVLGVERPVGDLLTEVEPVAQRPQLVPGHLLDAVGGVAGLDLGAKRPALDGLGQDHRGAALVLDRGLVGGVELAVVVTAPGQREELVVGEVLDQLAQPGVGPEEALPHVCPAAGGVVLELAVDRGVHLVQQDAVGVSLQQLVPTGAPDHLDDVPAGPPEGGLQLLDDLAVAPHRAVEPLQVAVDDEDEVVELVAGGDRQGAQRLGLVALAVAEEGPHP